MNTLNRRGFLGALLAAPAIVKAENIMRIWVPPVPKVVPAWEYARAGIAPRQFRTEMKGEFEWRGDGPITATEVLAAQRVMYKKIEAAMLQLSRVGYSTLDLSRLEPHQ